MVRLYRRPELPRNGGICRMRHGGTILEPGVNRCQGAVSLAVNGRYHLHGYDSLFQVAAMLSTDEVVDVPQSAA